MRPLHVCVCAMTACGVFIMFVSICFVLNFRAAATPPPPGVNTKQIGNLVRGHVWLAVFLHMCIALQENELLKKLHYATSSAVRDSP